MNLQMGILTASIIFGVSGLIFSLVCLANLRKKRNLLETLISRIEELENDFDECRDQLEDGKIRATDQARRIAWLEARIRKPEKIKKDILSQEVLTPKPAETNMTERRHRVLALAHRGQDAETISNTLGMLTGEVELIMSLGRGSANFA